MKTNAIISALCVVGIIGALCSNGEERRSVVEPRPGALPVQKVVYWSDIPGMKWDWSTQVTNAPAFVETNHHGRVRIEAPGSLAIGNVYDEVHAKSSASLALGANAIVERSYGGVALGIYAHTTNQFAFVYGGDYMSGKYYGDHGGGTFNLNPIGGLTGVWIGETNLATYLANAGSKEHTHSNLVNGTTQVIANQNGTASIVSAQSVQKPNCVRVSRADGTTGKTIVLSFKHTPDEFEQFQESWPSQVEFTITYDGVVYDAVTVGETDEEWGRAVSSSLSWANGGTLYPSGYGTFNPGSGWNGVFACSGTPGGVSIIGDGNGEICSTYTYTSETSISKTIATVDQLPSVSGFVRESDLVSAGYKAGPDEWVCDPSMFHGMDIQIEWSSGMGQWAMYAGPGRSQTDIIGIHSGSQSDTNLVWTAKIHWAGTNDMTSVKGGFRPYMASFVNTVNGIDAENIGILCDIPSTICDGYSYSNGVPQGTGIKIGEITATFDYSSFSVYDADVPQPSSGAPVAPMVIPLYIPSNVSSFSNDAGYVKTNAQGTLVVGSNQMQPNGGSWSLVMGSGGSHSKSDNTFILSPGSNIGTNSHYSAVFGPGAYIHDNAQYSFAFGGGVNIHDNCNDSFVVGSGAQSAHKCAFLWSANSNGGRNIPAQPITHGNGTFNINTYDGVAGVYIGDTNLQQIIRLEAKAMIRDAVSQVNVNLQSAEDTRVALTNLITILKNL